MRKNQFDQPIGTIIENWSARQLPAKKVLHGQYCDIEPIDLDKHAAKLFEVLQIDNQGESWTYLPYGPFNSFQEFHRWLSSVMAGDEMFYAIINKKTKLPVGMAGYLRINPEHGSIEVGHLHFSKLLKQTPAATEAMFLMMQYAFDEIGYRRYEWKCNSLNQPSHDAALRLGFKYEGTFRQSNVFKNQNRDTAWYSIIDSEWPLLKEKFQKWLSPKNFNANGKQIVRLQDI